VNDQRAAAVSVVIPVFNAGGFLERAVGSVLAQEEVREVLLVEDGSTDDSLVACERLDAANPGRVRLLRHEDGANRGAGASRNLGVRESSSEFVAFLDADDWMLPGRFSTSLAILEGDAEVDGVYEATEMHFADADAEIDWDWVAVGPRLVTVEPPDDPESLAEPLMLGRCGFFTTDGILLRKRAFEKAGYFNESLRLGQDTELWWRMALTCRLLPGSVGAPVAVYRRHAGCRSSAARPGFRNASKELALSVYRWAKRRGLPSEKVRIARSALAREVLKCLGCPPAGVALRLQQFLNVLKYAPRCPGILLDAYPWRRLRGALSGKNAADDAGAGG